MEQELYSWQKKCLTSWKENKYHGIVQAVTGAGKTKMAVAAIRLLQEHYGSKVRVKIIVPGKSLLSQWKHVLLETFSDTTDSTLSIGICGGGRNAQIEQDYMIYVINSARYRLARQILHELEQGYVIFLIADECHHYTSNENRKIFEFTPFTDNYPEKYCSLGLSATLNISGCEDTLVPVLGKIIYNYSLTHALKNNTICEFAIWQIAVAFQPDEQQKYKEITESMKHVRTKLLQLCPELRCYTNSQFFAVMKELSMQKNQMSSKLAKLYLQLSYSRKRVVYMADSRISCVCQLLQCLDQQKQTLIFGESIAQIEELYDKLSQMHLGKIGRYHSKRGILANKNTLERFQNGSLRILLTCHALDEGIDIPKATIGIILSGTAMERQRLQRLGRLLRKNNGKRMACLYYLFVADSQEERAYFPKFQECFHTENLSFDNETNNFCFPDYEKNARQVLIQATRQVHSESIYQETLTCLQKGLLREDWLLPVAECNAMAETADSIRERNYWLCMKQMSSSHKKDSTKLISI